MKQLVILALLTLLSFRGLSHGGEDHGDGKGAAPAAAGYFSSEALSDKYEVLMKYGELQAGAESVLQLFLSHALTNRPLDSATITIKAVGNPNLKFTVTRVDSGQFRVLGTFPQNAPYDLQVNISSPLGPDFLQVPKIEIGKKLQVVPEEHDHWYDSPGLWAGAGLLAGLLLMYFFMRTRRGKAAATVLVAGLLIPTAGMNPTSAHEGEEHGGGSTGGGTLSSSFIVEKESQFLFSIRTEKSGAGNFYQSSELFGTVTAAPQGRAVIQTPQTGKIVALRVTPGQTVAKGQTLAVIEQQVEAGTQIDLISQRNALNAEVKAAKAQYDRLLSIADIAAKKDVTEARARYEAAVQNLRLFNANIGGSMGSTKMISLKAPISGVVGTFNYAIGAVINSGETLFELTNLNRLYIETQVFSSGRDTTGKGSRYVALPANDTAAFSLRMVTAAQTVNTGNQAGRVVFEIVDPKGRFRIGENVRVLHYGGGRITQMVVPTSAIVDINGKPAVFIKDRAEGFSLSFIRKGESNPVYTAILEGAEAGERIVTGNVYQMKMIYLGQ